MKRRNIGRKRKKSQKSFFKWIALGVLVLIGGFLIFFLKVKYWNQHGKLGVVKSYGQDVVVSLYDVKEGMQTDIIIPANTQVLAAYGLGTWKLGSLWKLGSDEKIGGSLVTRTVSKNFGFPVFTWKDNLSAGDRLRIAIFNLLNRGGKDTIFLNETTALKKTVFMDGEKGYLVNSNIPEEILSLFSDEDEFGSLLKAKITDATGSYGIAAKVGGIIETMGIKVASISKDSNLNFGCRVIGKNTKLVRKVALILGCLETEIKASNAFDLDIHLGERFTQGF
jgi:hypothetical protein